MKWIKQSLDFLRKSPRESLIISILAMAALYLASLLHFAGAIVASICFVFLQAGVFELLSPKNQKFSLAWIFTKKYSAPLLLTSLVYVPTNIMMGTLIGLAQGSSSRLLAFVMILTFSFFCSLGYLLVGHTVGFILRKEMSFNQALEAALHGFKVHRSSLLPLSLLSTLLLLVAIIPLGLGLVVAIPLHFYNYSFSFRDLYDKTAAPDSRTLA